MSENITSEDRSASISISLAAKLKYILKMAKDQARQEVIA